MTTPTLYIVRHGQTDWNASHRLQGVSDVPLNALGKEQAQQSGRLLADLLKNDGLEPSTLDWHVSPLERTVVTSNLARATFETAIGAMHLDQRLIEISFGVYEGESVPELYASKRKSIQNWLANRWHHRPANGENYGDVAERLKLFLSSLDRPTVLVSHGGVTRTLRHILCGAAPEEMLEWLPVQGSVMKISKGTFEAFGE